MAGLTPRRLTPDEDRALLEHGLGVTDIAAPPTRAAAELTPEELREGAVAMADLVAEFRPRVLAVAAGQVGQPDVGVKAAQLRALEGP